MRPFSGGTAAIKAEGRIKFIRRLALFPLRIQGRINAPRPSGFWMFRMQRLFNRGLGSDLWRVLRGFAMKYRVVGGKEEPETRAVPARISCVARGHLKRLTRLDRLK